MITGATGAERIYDGYPDVALEMIEHRTFDDRIQLVEDKLRLPEHPPLGALRDVTRQRRCLAGDSVVSAVAELKPNP